MFIELAKGKHKLFRQVALKYEPVLKITEKENDRWL
jgi:hypothetical protein